MEHLDDEHLLDNAAMASQEKALLAEDVRECIILNVCKPLRETIGYLLEALDGVEKLMTMDGYEPKHFGGDKLVAAREAIAKAKGLKP